MKKTKKLSNLELLLRFGQLSGHMAIAVEKGDVNLATEIGTEVYPIMQELIGRLTVGRKRIKRPKGQ